MDVLEGSTLTFEIPSIFKDMEYDLVVRHEHNPDSPNTWENANVELIRIDGPVDPEGKCNDTQDGKIPFSMEAGTTVTEITPPLCLEEGQRYQLKFSFDQYDSGSPDPTKSILIDSVSTFNLPNNFLAKILQTFLIGKIIPFQIALLPRTDSLEIFEDFPEKKTEYEDNKCRDLLIEGKRPDNITEPCKSLLLSISYHALRGGQEKECNCDPTGSKSALCDKYTGQCDCKKNVYGRKCERCWPGFYGFGADGCARK